MATENAFLDKFGVTVLWNSLKNYINKVMPKKISAFSNDEGYIKGISTLTFTGALEATFDGKHNVTINIPNSSGEVTPGTTNYNDLTNKPSINGILLSGNKTLSNLGINIPTRVSQLSNDADYLTSSSLAGYVKRTDLTNVAFTGSYNSLTNKPTIPVLPSNVSAFYNDAGYLTTHQDISGKADNSALQALNSKLLNEYYNRTQVLNLINEAVIGDQQINLLDYYTKDEANNRFLTEHLDISGKVDISTLSNYYTAQEVNNLLNDLPSNQGSQVDETKLIHKEGAETITGKKTFTTPITLGNGSTSISGDSSNNLVTGNILTSGLSYRTNNSIRSASHLWDTNGKVRSLSSIIRVYKYNGSSLVTTQSTTNNSVLSSSNTAVTWNELNKLPELYSTFILYDNEIYSLHKAYTSNLVFKYVDNDLSTSKTTTTVTEKIILATSSSQFNNGYFISHKENSRTMSLSESNYFTITSFADDNKIYFRTASSNAAKTIEVSDDGGESWHSITATTSLNDDEYITTINTKESLIFRGNNSDYKDNYFYSSGDIEVSGNIMSLIYPDISTFSISSSVNSAYTFAGLFKNCTHLYYAGDLVLPAKVLSAHCYASMFYGCSSLTVLPKLPATTLADACYSHMFYRCSSITTIPELPAMKMEKYCYAFMFAFSNIYTAPKLPSTSLATGCYEYMFNSCDNLTESPDLPATSLATSCYEGMFEGCRALSKVPETLPGNAESCFMNMFKGCIFLETPPELPATYVLPNCYYSMFEDCTSLRTTPELPATYMRSGISGGCYCNMFKGCTALTKAPELPAMRVRKNCYASMFEGCISLTDAPSILPAMDLMEETTPDMECYGCYARMFKDCTHLETTPVLPALKLVLSCYEEMFYACMAIDHVECMATDISATDCTKDWMYKAGEVASSRLFTKGTVANWSRDDNGIPTNWNTEESQSQHYLTFNILTGGAITWNGVNNDKALEYSTNNGTSWTTLSINSSITVAADDIVLFRGELYGNSINDDTDKYCYFSTSNGATFNVSGNAMSLIEGENYIGVVDLSQKFSYKYLFANLFKGCTGIKDAGNMVLPATVLSEYCYYGMFMNSGIIQSPILPALQLAKYCYASMFEGCTSLSDNGAPSIPETNLYNAEYCCMNMFKGCTAFITENSPINLPATKLVEGCYQGMFEGCENMYAAPILPAVTLPSKCYKQMFKDCTFLLRINCAAWSIDGIYDESTTNDSYPTKDWCNNVHSSGTFITIHENVWVRGADGIPTGWSISATGSAGSKPSGRFWDDEEEPGGATEIPTFQANSDDYSKKYLTLEILTDGIVRWNTDNSENTKTILYSFDGSNWESIVSTESGEIIIVREGDTLMIRGSETSYEHSFFSSTAQFNLSGNITSLVNGGVSIYNAIPHLSMFKGLFKGCDTLISAENLYLPQAVRSRTYEEMFMGCINLTTAPYLSNQNVDQYCYASMFENCISLVNAPELAVGTLSTGCYKRMFYGCANINNIVCKATSLATDCFTEWTVGVAENGIFTKKSATTIPAGTSGIPSGWVVKSE